MATVRKSFESLEACAQAQLDAAGMGDDTEPSLLAENPFVRARLLRLTRNMLRVLKPPVRDNDRFAIVADILTRDAVIELVRQVCLPPLLEEMSKAKGSDCLNLNGDSAKEIVRIVWNHHASHEPFQQRLFARLQGIADDCEKLTQPPPENNVFQKRFNEVVSLFGLDPHEADMLFLAYIRHAGIWSPYDGNRAPTADKLQTIAAILQVPPSVCADMLGEKGRLRKYQCLDGDFDINPALDAFLAGLSNEPLVSRYFSRSTEAALPLTMYGKLAEDHGQMLKTLLKAREPDRGVNILFHGEPGTGKTAFAHTMAAELGLDLYLVSPNLGDAGNTQPDNSRNFRFAALHVCDAQVDPARSLILVDEADEMLRGRNSVFSMFFGGASGSAGDKGLLNIILDDLKTPCIWITNTSPDALNPSSRRRFDYSIRFDKLSRSQRCQVWKNVVGRYRLEGIIDDAMIESFASRYGISAGGIDLALRNCARILKQEPTAYPSGSDLLEKLLKPHCELLDIALDKGVQIAADYSLEGLNVAGKVQPQQILDAVRQFRLRQESGQQPGPDAPRMNILLHGPPGTGKTEFVKFLGGALDCPVQTKMGGDFLDRYVGGTEQNIRQAFRSAENDRAILFIDEADGMFRSRQLAERGWEVTQVNELLNAMENFKGVLVCATNAFDALDPATIRRFTFKLAFGYLDQTGKRLFYQRMLADLCPQPLSESQVRRLAGIDDLAPGDFRTVRQALYYLAGPGICHNQLLDALEQESRAKQQDRPGGRRIGF